MKMILEPAHGQNCDHQSVFLKAGESGALSKPEFTDSLLFLTSKYTSLFQAHQINKMRICCHSWAISVHAEATGLLTGYKKGDCINDMLYI